jgi:penicillin-binding protein 1C
MSEPASPPTPRAWWRRRGLIAPLAAAALVCLLAAWIRCGPLDPSLLDDGPSVSTIVVDRNGTVIYESRAATGTRGIALGPDRLPPVLVAATLAAEDRRFFSHLGVDPIAVARALAHDLRQGRLVEGGSTITQQVAKLLLARRDPGRRRGAAAKIAEAVLALRLEHRFSKREILARYLNLAGYGNQVAGAERASLAYFGCPASMATPAQAAFLAALPQQPSRFNPWRDARSARARQRAVLRQMLASGDLAEARWREAIAERLVLSRPQASPIAPHFVEMALAEAGTPRPPRVDTTLDAGLQAAVRAIVDRQRPALEAHGAANAAVVVLDNATGDWLAWEGSGDYFDADHGGAINGPLVPRQPGSALKPLTYALAFERGFTPASVLPDIPSHFPTAKPGVVYTPRNYDGRYRGPLLARRALAGSENVPAVALASELGVPPLLRFFARAGLTTLDRTAAYYGVGVTLGNAEVTLAELTAAYAAFARDGLWKAPHAVRRPAGAAASSPDRELTTATAAFWVTDILSDAEAREYIFGRGGSLEFPFPVAAKTGTSQAYHDNWTIGYTREVTVGVWVGNFDRAPLRDSSGVTGAAPIFHAVMLAARGRATGTGPLEPSPPLAVPPAGLERVEICALSGMRANRWCPSKIREWLPEGEERLPCSWHHESDEGLLVVWPAEYRAWAAGHGLLQDLVPSARAARVDRGEGGSDAVPGAEHGAPSIQIASPPDGATYLIDPTLRREFQALSLRAVARPRGPVEWRVDGRSLGASDSDDPVGWPLAPGTHHITARAASGASATATIVVR